METEHTDASGKPVHVDTLVHHLKKGALVGKRTRHSLKKRDEANLERCLQEIAALSAQAGEFRLAIQRFTSRGT